MDLRKFEKGLLIVLLGVNNHLFQSLKVFAIKRRT